MHRWLKFVLVEITDLNLSLLVKLLNVTVHLITSAEYWKKKLFASKFLPRFSCCTAHCHAQNKLKFGAKILVAHSNFAVKICYVKLSKPNGNRKYNANNNSRNTAKFYCCCWYTNTSTQLLYVSAFLVAIFRLYILRFKSLCTYVN